MRKRGLSAEQVGDGITRMLVGGRPESRLSKEARVAKAKKDFRFFCRYYLAQHFQSEPAEFHAEMGGLLRSHDRVACAAPREHAKSTVVSFAYVLFVMLFGLHHFVVIFRDGEETARQNVDDVRREFEENERIIEDFGDQIGSRKWTESEFITASGVKLIARGRGSSVRGLRFKQYRPGLVILDDIEDDQAVESKVQRDKLGDGRGLALLMLMDLEDVRGKHVVQLKASTESDAQDIYALNSTTKQMADLLERFIKASADKVAISVLKSAIEMFVHGIREIDGGDQYVTKHAARIGQLVTAVVEKHGK